MKNKNYFLSLMGTAILSILFVSCSADNEEQQITKPNAKLRSAPLNIPHGSLYIINHTIHKFVGNLVCINLYGSGLYAYSLYQKIIIYPNSEVTLTKYASTSDLGITNSGDDIWNIYNATTPVFTKHGWQADQSFRNTFLGGTYVSWFFFGDNSTVSEDGFVGFRFKNNVTSGDIFVSDSQNYSDGTDTFVFTPSVTIDAVGDTYVTLNEILK